MWPSSCCCGDGCPVRGGDETLQLTCFLFSWKSLRRHLRTKGASSSSSTSSVASSTKTKRTQSVAALLDQKQLGRRKNKKERKLWHFLHIDDFLSFSLKSLIIQQKSSLKRKVTSLSPEVPSVSLPRSLTLPHPSTFTSTSRDSLLSREGSRGVRG